MAKPPPVDYPWLPLPLVVLRDTRLSSGHLRLYAEIMQAERLFGVGKVFMSYDLFARMTNSRAETVKKRMADLTSWNLITKEKCGFQSTNTITVMPINKAYTKAEIAAATKQPSKDDLPEKPRKKRKPRPELSRVRWQQDAWFATLTGKAGELANELVGLRREWLAERPKKNPSRELAKLRRFLFRYARDLFEPTGVGAESDHRFLTHAATSEILVCSRPTDITMSETESLTVVALSEGVTVRASGKFHEDHGEHRSFTKGSVALFPEKASFAVLFLTPGKGCDHMTEADTTIVGSYRPDLKTGGSAETAVPGALEPITPRPKSRSGFHPRQETAKESGEAKTAFVDSETASLAGVDAVEEVPNSARALASYFGTVVKKHFSDALVRSDPVDIKRCNHLLDQFSRSELFQMIELLVLDWSGIRNDKRFFPRAGETPQIADIFKWRGLLATYIGKGFTAGTNPVSAYRTQYENRHSPDPDRGRDSAQRLRDQLASQAGEP